LVFEVYGDDRETDAHAVGYPDAGGHDVADAIPIRDAHAGADAVAEHVAGAFAHRDLISRSCATPIIPSFHGRTAAA
jgi:hypothetical protein